MKRRVLRLTVLLLAGAAGGAAIDAGANDLVVPEGGLVIDGGDAEAARAAEGSCPDPSLAEAPGRSVAEAPGSAPSLAGPAGPAPSLAGEAPGGPPAPSQAATPARRPVAFEYSDGYRTRLKIHKYASFATLPLFVAQFAVGQKLYDGSASDGARSLHGVLAGGTAALFAVNTVTGVWNLSEGRKDPTHRTKRMVHGILMALADAGFVATGLMTPESEHDEFEFEGGEGGGTSRSTHRAVALASMGIASVAYVMMLIH